MDKINKLYSITDSALGIYPVGFAAIIIAESKEEAKKLFEAQMKKEGLESNLVDRFGISVPYSIQEEFLTVPSCIIFVNGNQ